MEAWDWSLLMPLLLPEDPLLETSVCPQGNRYMRLSLVALTLQQRESSLKMNTSRLTRCVSKGQQLKHTLQSRTVNKSWLAHVPPSLPDRDTNLGALGPPGVCISMTSAARKRMWINSHLQFLFRHPGVWRCCQSQILSGFIKWT